MIFAIITVSELIYDKAIDGIFLKKIKKRGWLLIFIAVVSVGFNLLKDRQSDRLQKEYDKAKNKNDSLLFASQKESHRLQMSTKDTIIKKVEDTYQKSIKASNDALAKYNLKITDSMRSVVNTLKLNAVNPQLSFVPLGGGSHPAFLKNDQNKNILCIQFKSFNGTSYHIMLTCHLLQEAPGGFFLLYSDTLTFGEGFITDDIFTTLQTEIKPVILTYSDLIVFVTGTFSKDPEGKLIIPFNKAFKYNFKDNNYITGCELKYEELKKGLHLN
jgi:predicted Holliday junction resolvase-like endonuclease